ncbi:hypothetical protein PAMP_002831 [Pampus punctatissimus]
MGKEERGVKGDKVLREEMEKNLNINRQKHRLPSTTHSQNGKTHSSKSDPKIQEASSFGRGQAICVVWAAEKENGSSMKQETKGDFQNTWQPPIIASFYDGAKLPLKEDRRNPV